MSEKETVCEVRFLMPLVRFVHTIISGYTIVIVGQERYLMLLVINHQDKDAENEEMQKEEEEEEEEGQQGNSEGSEPECHLYVIPEATILSAGLGAKIPESAEVRGCKIKHMAPFTQTHYMCKFVGFGEVTSTTTTTSSPSSSITQEQASINNSSSEPSHRMLTVTVSMDPSAFPNPALQDYVREVSEVVVNEADRMKLSYGCQFGTIIRLRSLLEVGTPLLRHPLEPEPAAGTGYIFSWLPTYASPSRIVRVQEWGLFLRHSPRVVVMIDERTCLPLSLVHDRDAAALLVAMLEKLEELAEAGTNVLELMKATPAPTFGVSLRKRYPEGVVPPVVRNTVRFLTKIAPSHRMIFRVSGSKEEIDVLRAAYDMGVPVDLDQCINKDTVGSFLKRYLMDLPEPLIPWDVFLQYADLGRSEGDDSEDLFKLIAVATGRTERAILVKLIRLVQLIISNVEHTKMGAHAVAVCIVPSITRNLSNKISMEDVKQLTYIINLFEKKIFTTDITTIERAFDEHSMIL